MKKSPLLLKLQPFGMTLSGEGQRPLLLLKDESGELTLPVPLSPLEAGVTLSQSNKTNAPATPHKVTELLLQSMSMRISKCVFKEMRGAHQTVELALENHPRGIKTLDARAEDAMSLCLQLNVPIFASKEFIQKSRVSVADLQGQAQNLLLNPRILHRTHPYIM